MYSTLELKLLNKENNEKFSDFIFILGVFKTSWFHGNSLFLFISFPMIYSYYKEQKEKEYNLYPFSEVFPKRKSRNYSQDKR